VSGPCVIQFREWLHSEFQITPISYTQLIMQSLGQLLRSVQLLLLFDNHIILKCNIKTNQKAFYHLPPNQNRIFDIFDCLKWEVPTFSLSEHKRWMVNGKCEILWEGKTSIFLCKTKTFFLQLGDWDFKVFYGYSKPLRVSSRKKFARTQFSRKSPETRHQ